MARSQGACPGPGCGLRAGCGRGSRAQGGGGGSGTWRGVRDLCADEGLGGGVRHCAGLLRAPPTPVQTADQGRLWQVRSRASRLPAHGRPGPIGPLPGLWASGRWGGVGVSTAPDWGRGGRAAGAQTRQVGTWPVTCVCREWAGPLGQERGCPGRREGEPSASCTGGSACRCPEPRSGEVQVLPTHPSRAPRRARFHC